jgi:integrase
MWLNPRRTNLPMAESTRINVNQATPCIVAVMEEYFRRTHLLGALPGDSLFSVPGLPTLTSTVLSGVMKATVTAMGLPADRVSTHSLRYGGATMLASGGYPEYIIAMYGGWAEGSTSLRRYTRPTSIRDRRRLPPHAG